MTICGILDTKLSVTNNPNSQNEQFKILFSFFERMVAVGNCTRVALQWGIAATGADWWDGANPFKTNAFAVYEFSSATPKFTVLIQYGTYAGGGYVGQGVGAPGQLDGSASSYGCGIALALCEDGSSPWAGTTDDDGADTKGDPVWTAGGSTLYVVDRSCSSIAAAGSFVAKKENLLTALPGTYSYRSRMHMVGNSDGFAILNSAADDGNYTIVAGGIYTPRPGLVVTHTLPVVAWKLGTPLADPASYLGATAAYGIPAGTGSYGGGIVGRPADLVSELYIGDALAQFHTTSTQPNQQPALPELDLSPILLAYANTARAGYVGTFPTELLAFCANANNQSTNSAGTVAYLGSPTVANLKYAIPWDGGLAPGALTTRDGRTF